MAYATITYNGTTWKFDIPAQETVTHEADVTEHYTESGSYIEDHIIIKPIKIQLGGFIGELVHKRDNSDSGGNSATVASKLTDVDAYHDEQTDQGSQIQTASQTKAQEDIDSAQSETEQYNGTAESQSLQTQAYNQIISIFKAKQVVSCQTPWAIFDSMLIESVVAKQDEDSDEISEFTVALKEARFTDTEVVDFNEDLIPQAQAVQAQDTKEEGPIQGEQVTINKTLFLQLLQAAGIFK